MLVFPFFFFLVLLFALHSARRSSEEAEENEEEEEAERLRLANNCAWAARYDNARDFSSQCAYYALTMCYVIIMKSKKKKCRKNVAAVVCSFLCATVQ